MLASFKTKTASPPSGCYEYGVGDKVVTSRSQFEISRMAAELRAANGLRTVGDPFLYVMDYMCPRLPDGFCNTKSTVKSLRMEEVKRVTSQLFPIPCVTSDRIAARLEKCVSCKMHETRGFCMSCTGLLEWIRAGFNGRRPPLPPDAATGVCCVTKELTAASASVDREPAGADQGFPEGCWRLTSDEEE